MTSQTTKMNGKRYSSALKLVASFLGAAIFGYTLYKVVPLLCLLIVYLLYPMLAFAV